MLLKPGLGQQLGHALALKGSRPSKSNYQAVKENKGLKNAEKVLVLLTVQVPLLSPLCCFLPLFLGLCPPVPLAVLSQAPWGFSLWPRTASLPCSDYLCSLSASLPRAQRRGSWPSALARPFPLNQAPWAPVLWVSDLFSLTRVSWCLTLCS